MSGLYSENTLASFWKLDQEVFSAEWEEAIEAARQLMLLGWTDHVDAVWRVLADRILGESQFGDDRWRLSIAKRAYYMLRAFLPKVVRPLLRRVRRGRAESGFRLRWPQEDRYVRFLGAVLETVRARHPKATPTAFWPNAAGFAFVLTHDVEAGEGMRFVGPLADLEEELGFRSSFNFVPEGYQVDGSLLEQLRRRGFEIGVHGLRHDGKDFWSKRVFEQRAIRINGYLREWEAVGFRAPFTHRNPEWMQLLEIEYDSSFFDTDPYESMPGGTMSIWPFFCGRFVELPYTLMQDHTLFEVFGETARPWLEKVDFIARWGGMALVNAHPDYLRVPARLAVYREFLGTVANQMKQAQDSGRHYCWHSLPREVARWWRRRCQGLERGVDERPATTPAGTSGKNGP